MAARIRRIDDYSGHADRSELTRWIASRCPIRRGIFLVHGEEPAITGLSDTIADRLIPSAKIFLPLLDDIYDLSTEVPTNLNATNRRRLAPESVVELDWHNDMSKLILDINEKVAAAADDRARNVLIRRLKRALDPEN